MGCNELLFGDEAKQAEQQQQQQQQQQQEAAAGSPYCRPLGTSL